MLKVFAKSILVLAVLVPSIWSDDEPFRIKLGPLTLTVDPKELQTQSNENLNLQGESQLPVATNQDGLSKVLSKLPPSLNKIIGSFIEQVKANVEIQKGGESQKQNGVQRESRPSTDIVLAESAHPSPQNLGASLLIEKLKPPANDKIEKSMTSIQKEINAPRTEGPLKSPSDDNTENTLTTRNNYYKRVDHVAGRVRNGKVFAPSDVLTDTNNIRFSKTTTHNKQEVIHNETGDANADIDKKTTQTSEIKFNRNDRRQPAEETNDSPNSRNNQVDDETLSESIGYITLKTIEEAPVHPTADDAPLTHKTTIRSSVSKLHKLEIGNLESEVKSSGDSTLLQTILGKRFENGQPQIPEEAQGERETKTVNIEKEINETTEDRKHKTTETKRTTTKIEQTIVKEKNGIPTETVTTRFAESSECTKQGGYCFQTMDNLNGEVKVIQGDYCPQDYTCYSLP